MKRVAVTVAAVIAITVLAPMARADGDTAPPVLSSFAMTSPTTVRPGDEVIVDYAASDAGAGIHQVTFSFSGAERGFGPYAIGDAAASGPARATIPSWMPPGTYTLETVALSDNAANFVYYGADSRVRVSPGGATAPTSHDFDLASVTFTVENPNGDTVAPAMNSFSRSPVAATAGGSVTLDYVASDVGSGVAFVFFNYKTPTGNSLSASSSGEFAASGPATMTVPETAPTGTYTLHEITVIDHAHYYTHYRRDGTVKTTPPGANGPTENPFDLSQGDFTVVNPNSDTTTPELRSFVRQSPDTVRPGDAVTMTYNASDLGSGLKRVTFGFVTPIGNLFRVEVYGAAAVDGPASTVVADTRPGGRYWLNDVTLVDEADNYTWYRRNGDVWISPSGASGPGTKHELDLTLADFTVDNGVPVTTSTTTTSSTSTTVAPTTTTTAPGSVSAAQITTGAGAGGGPHVRSFAADGTALTTSFFAWSSRFGGGVPVARGDLDGDGRDEIVAGSGQGGAAFAVFSADGAKRFVRKPFGAFAGGVNVAVGDVRGDARPEIVVAAGPGGAPHVRVYSNTGEALGEGFTAYSSGFSGGVRVAVGRIDGATKARIVTGPGAGGGPHVRAFNATGAPVGGNGFFAYAPSFSGGVFVATGDLDGDGRAEVVTGPDAGGGPHVRGFRLDGGEVFGVMAYASTFTGGVRVAAGNLNRDRKAEVVTGPGPGGGPHVRAFSGSGAALAVNFFAYHPSSTSGTFVAVGRA